MIVQKRLWFFVLVWTELFPMAVHGFAATVGGPSTLRPNDVDSMTFREILEIAGKKVFRPGGSQATQKLHKWAKNINSNARIIEFASGPGSGLDFVQDTQAQFGTGCTLLITDPKQEGLIVARETAQNRGLTAQYQQMEITNLESLQDQRFDVALVEAILTRYERSQKLSILQNLHGMADQICLHEICIRGCDQEDESCQDIVKDRIGEALKTKRIGYHPLTTSGWIRILEEAGYRITDIETGPIQLIKPGKAVKEKRCML
jgi:hypothetical protein